MRSIIDKIPKGSLLDGPVSVRIGYPPFPFGAITFLENVIDSKTVVLEAGCGGSTVFWGRNCKSVTSFETNPEWYRQVYSKVRFMRNIKLILGERHDVSVGFVSVEDNSCDIVLINSDPLRTKRVDLANIAKNKVKPGGFLLLNNYQKFGMDSFNYSGFYVYTFDEMDYPGIGMRICKKL